MSITCSCGSEQCRKTVSTEPLKDGRAALILRRGDGALINGMILDRDGMTELRDRIDEMLGGRA